MKKNNVPFYKLKRTYVILILLFIFIGIIGQSQDDTLTPTTSNTTNDKIESNKDVSEETSQTQTQTEEQIEYTKYDVSELVDDLNNNPLAAKEKYEKKYVELTGKLGTIDSKGKYISIYPDNDDFALTSIMCYVKTDEQKSLIATLSKGDKIIVKGKIKDVGEILGYYLDIDEISKS